MALYDTIGKGYKNLRQQDPRIAQLILQALGNSKTVINVGAGAGSYEPRDRNVTAVEPSMTMIKQRPKDSAGVVCATAEALPFRDTHFDAGLAVLTIHHWTDKKNGLDELGRIAREKIVLLTFDPAADYFWLADYFPEIPALDQDTMPPIADIEKHFGTIKTINVPIPHDCTDGFLCAYWRRPHAYLEAKVRAAISSFAKIKDPAPGLQALKADLDSGDWNKKYGYLLNQSELDAGYRIIVADLH